MSKKFLYIKGIINNIDDIEFILEGKNLKITQTIEDKIIKPAFRMHLIKIAESFSKPKQDNEFEILSKFSKNDLRGISAVINYIVHGYDSTDDTVIEDVLRYDLLRLKTIAKGILKDIVNS